MAIDSSRLAVKNQSNKRASPVPAVRPSIHKALLVFDRKCRCAAA
jgi:hypothetical protein